MYLHLDITDTALPDVGYILITQAAAHDQGENVSLFIAKSLHGCQYFARFFLGDIGFFLIGNGLLADFLTGDEPIILPHLIVKKIPTYGKEQRRTLFAVAISLQIAGKALLYKIGGKSGIAGLSQKITKKFIPVIDIELSKSVHSIALTDFSHESYKISAKKMTSGEIFKRPVFFSKNL